MHFSEEFPTLTEYVTEWEHRLNFYRKQADPNNKYAFKKDNLLSKLIAGAKNQLDKIYEKGGAQISTGNFRKLILFEFL